MSYHFDTILVTVYDDHDAFWYPRVFSPAELGEYLRGRAEYDPGQQIRVWDIDGKGQPHECELQTRSTGYDEDDWAHVDVRVFRKGSKGTQKLVASTGYRVDGRA
jgi:hypothetical protein